MPGIARFALTALDCPDARTLAEFYSALTGWPIGSADDEWVELRSDGGATLAFQTVERYIAPVWPSAEQPQQAHLDFDVADLDEGEAQVVALGATKAEVQPKHDAFRVFLDPAGHPFCLVRE